MHLIRAHHCRRICYVGCESELDSSDPRRDLCAEVMHKYGLSFGEEDSANCSPDLTTVTFPLHEMGAKAFDLLRDCFTGKAPLPEETVIPSQPVYRGSCCAQKKHDLPNPLFYENHLLRKVNDREAAMLSDIKLSAALHSVMDLDDGMDLLEGFVSAIEDCQELYLCLYPDWDHISILMFLRNINSMLARIFDIRQTGILVHRPEDISDRDELTQLPNRSGFRLLTAAASKGKTLLAMRFELADLPQITKQYGRAERDFAICVAGHALEGAVSAPNREALFTSETHPAADQSGTSTEVSASGGASAANICISHQGGGEFLLLASVDEAEKENRANFFTRSIETYLDNYTFSITQLCLFALVPFASLS
ncbi:MAG: substrate-binding domain-containing protein [Lachnospiraceae bacterium]|nr:substrate-binding domain-containing protein [Lachnospiraceae bacterium]